VREALRRLGARGLVVQRPGRMARAVGLDASLTLENVGLALHDERSSESRWLLEGFFSLKRQVLVELLADCCVRASDVDLDPLERACFALWDAGRWESGERCARLEFELLRLAARGADRPGHLLLVQSLQWALWGSASRLLPHMGGEAVRSWAICAMNALAKRDVQAIQHALPALLKACDDRVLERFAPAPQEESPTEVPPEVLPAPRSQLDAPESAPRESDLETDAPVETRSSCDAPGASCPERRFESVPPLTIAGHEPPASTGLAGPGSQGPPDS
jgi:GntR family transcriptional regulator, transcriptional repressor for pyruvate dehydrogenase complex